MPELILVRHGETDGQSSIRLNGATDVGLSPLGRQQMTRVAEALAAESFERVLVSPLRRSQQSAAIVRPGAEMTLIPGFREIHFGRWETWTFAEAAERDPQTYAEWSRGEVDFAFPGGESRQGFYQRVRDAALTTLLPLEQRTLAVLHKGVIKAILGALLERSWEAYRAAPCHLGSIHRLHIEGQDLVLQESNLTSHLGETWQEDHPAISLSKRSS